MSLTTFDYNRVDLRIREGFIFLVCVLVPIADTFGATVKPYLPLALILRLVVWVFAACVLITTRTISKWLRLMLFFTGVFFLIQVVVHFFIFQDPRLLSMESASIMKLLYFPALLLALYAVAVEGVVSKEAIHSSLIFLGALILVSLLLGEISGFGGSIAGRGVDIEGKKGFMIGANEVGLMLLLTVPITISLFQRYAPFRFFPYLSLLVVYSAAGLLVFTKSSLVAPFVALIGLLGSGISNGSRIRRFLFLISISIAAAILTYFVISRIGDLIEFAMKTFIAALIDDGILSFVFRGRETYIDAIYPQLIGNDNNLLILLFGSGEYYIRAISVAPLQRAFSDGTMFEMDLFDLIGSVGLVGSFLYFSVTLLTIKKVRIGNMLFINKMALMLAVMHSFLAGHVIFSPQVTTIIALILLLHSEKFCKSRQMQLVG
jgi:hypothetical protein